MPHYFVFTSYAQLDRDDYLQRFIGEFRQELRALTGGPDLKVVTFFDRDGVKAGDRWSEEILHAVNDADVLLCLMSPTYFTREWCGRELTAFLQRYGGLAPAAAQQRFIFPVWWQMPAAPRPLPSRLGQYHHRDPQYPPSYELQGVRGLARKRLWGQFQKVVDRLAQLIAQTLAQPHRLPPGAAVADIAEIANAFDEQQPYDVRMLALMPGGDSWQPSTADVTVAEAAAVVAQRVPVFVRRLPLNPATLTADLHRVQAEEQVLLLVVDATSVADATVTAINGLSLPNLALLLVDAATPPVGGEAWLGTLPVGAFARAREAGLMRVAAAGELTAQMERLVDEARRRLQAAAPATKVRDARLDAKAQAEGISTSAQPNLTGPGGDEPQ